MFGLSSDWKFLINESRVAILDKNGEIVTPIAAIEPSINFTFNTIGIYITSPNAPNHWYGAGEVFQIFKVGYGTAGYAQGESVRIVLNRYHIHRFNIFPFMPNKTRYLLSYLPKYYLKNINFKVWEYTGIDTIGSSNCTNSEKQLIANTPIIILNANPARQYSIFTNNSNVDITLILGEPTPGLTSINKGIIIKPYGGSYEINNNNLYLGKVSAIAPINCNLSFVECV